MVMSVPFRGAGQLAGVVVGLISGQVEERLFERGDLRRKLEKGDAVCRSSSADCCGVEPGNDHVAIRDAFDKRAEARQRVGECARF